MQQSYQNSKDFNVLILCPLINDKSFEIAIKTFYNFFYSLTPKHRSRIHLIVLNANEEQNKAIESQNSNYDTVEPVIISLKNNQSSLLEEIKKGNTLLFHPASTVTESLRIELLSACLPILTYSYWENAHGFDSAACILLSSKLETQSTKEFSNLLKILYFDQWALKMLKTKAIAHRRSSVVRQTAMSY
jgi:hypothetical protein